MRSMLAVELRVDGGVLFIEVRPDAARRLTVRVQFGLGTYAQDGTREETAELETLTPLFSSPLPRVAEGGRQVLRAVLEDARIMVLVDGRAVWGGELPDHEPDPSPALKRLDPEEMR